MEQANENCFEEITDFPEQSTFNYDNMIIDEQEANHNGFCNADK